MVQHIGLEVDLLAIQKIASLFPSPLYLLRSTSEALHTIADHKDHKKSVTFGQCKFGNEWFFFILVILGDYLCLDWHSFDGRVMRIQ